MKMYHFFCISHVWWKLKKDPIMLNQKTSHILLRKREVMAFPFWSDCRLINTLWVVIYGDVLWKKKGWYVMHVHFLAFFYYHLDRLKLQHGPSISFQSITVCQREKKKNLYVSPTMSAPPKMGNNNLHCLALCEFLFSVFWLASWQPWDSSCTGTGQVLTWKMNAQSLVSIIATVQCWNDILLIWERLNIHVYLQVLPLWRCLPVDRASVAQCTTGLECGVWIVCAFAPFYL